MRFNYKIIPVATPDPAHPKDTTFWMPMMPVRLSYGHGQQTPRIEALIDSGAPDCIFGADIADFLKIKLENGIKGSLGGVVHGPRLDAYYHDVNLWVGADRVKIRAAFARGLSARAILGRRGFFENFIVTFDPSNNPPGFEIQRLGRA